MSYSLYSNTYDKFNFYIFSTNKKYSIVNKISSLSLLDALFFSHIKICNNLNMNNKNSL